MSQVHLRTEPLKTAKVDESIKHPEHQYQSLLKTLCKKNYGVEPWFVVVSAGHGK